jgi:hypothetical protein
VSAAAVPIPEALRAYVVLQLRASYDPPEDVAARALEYFSGDDELDVSAVSTEALDAVVAEELRVLEAEQAAWPAVTDNDRLARAFARLEARGVVARENFTCCQSCGHAEIGDEIDATEARGLRVHGYTFFHQQDTESAVEGGGVMLAYGALTAGTPDPAVAVGHEIMAMLREAGLSPEWDGAVTTRIFVPLAWRRRRGAE